MDLCQKRWKLQKSLRVVVDHVEDDVRVLRRKVLHRLGRRQRALVAIDMRHQDHGRGDRVVLQDVTHAGLVDQHVVVDLRADELG